MFHKTSNVSLLGGRTSDWNRAFEILDRYSVLRLSVSRRDLSEAFFAGRCVPESFCRPDFEFPLGSSGSFPDVYISLFTKPEDKDVI